MLSKRLVWIWPCLLTLLVSGAYISARLVINDFDPLALAEIGSRYAAGEINGEPGYDGQFSYYIARDPDPVSVAPLLDTPAYRYQRILYPLLARYFALGRQAWIPWALLALNWVTHGLATLGISWLLHSRGINVAYALIYGLWVGLIAAVGLDLHEPLAYGFVVSAWVMKERGHETRFALCLILALFAKETTLLFWLAALLPAWKLGKKSAFFLLIGGGVLFAAWQFWLLDTFGSIGIASGGDMASGFEIIPFMGIIRIGFVKWQVFWLFLLIFGPTVILPTVWGFAVTLKDGMKTILEWSGGSLILHSLLIVFLPFSTFREPLGLVRIASGLVLAILMFASEKGHKRQLNYGLFWIAMLAMLIPQESI